MKRKVQICRLYGSSKGCKYGKNCLYSHSYPESVKMCRFILKNKQCFAGNDCSFRHILYENDKKKQLKESIKPSVSVKMLENVYIEYYQHEQYEKVQFYVSWKEEKNYIFRTENAHKLLNYLSNNNAYDLIANIGLFVDKKSSYSNNKWYEWLKQDIKTYSILNTLKKTQIIIIKIRALINHYNLNYKYMAKTFNPSTYYKNKLIVNGFINHILQKTSSNKYCPDVIITLCFKFYYEMNKNALFDHTSTVKISDDKTIIGINKNDAKIENLPFILYKNKSFKIFKIKCLYIPNNLTLSIGIINDLKHLNIIKNVKNIDFWPFDITEMHILSGINRPKQFYFGDKNDDRRKINKNDIYCGILSNNDIITMQRKTKQIKVKSRYSYNNSSHTETKHIISLRIDSKNGSKQYECPQFDGFPALAFDFIVDQEIKFKILDLD